PLAAFKSCGKGLGDRKSKGVPMSFFGKLKDRLFKSSSKLDEGIGAIVDDAPAVADPAPQAPLGGQGAAFAAAAQTPDDAPTEAPLATPSAAAPVAPAPPAAAEPRPGLI